MLVIQVEGIVEGWGKKNRKFHAPTLFFSIHNGISLNETPTVLNTILNGALYSVLAISLATHLMQREEKK